eukprot:9286278-Pyramimonas_sp.AAC.2
MDVLKARVLHSDGPGLPKVPARVSGSVPYTGPPALDPSSRGGPQPALQAALLVAHHLGDVSRGERGASGLGTCRLALALKRQHAGQGNVAAGGTVTGAVLRRTSGA